MTAASGRAEGERKESGGERRRPCPICGRPPAARYQPFCSKCCADVDLGRWLGEVYRIPAADDPEAEDAETEDAGAAANDRDRS